MSATENPTLSGTLAAGTVGDFTLMLTAGNDVAPDASQNFTLTVDQAPTITSANNTTFTVGTSGSFTVGEPTFLPSLASKAMATSTCCGWASAAAGSTSTSAT